MLFNEGGADCPPIVCGCCRACIFSLLFNEGGADCPPIELLKRAILGQFRFFNEGGADCPPIAPQVAGEYSFGVLLQ